MNARRRDVAGKPPPPVRPSVQQAARAGKLSSWPRVRQCVSLPYIGHRGSSHLRPVPKPKVPAMPDSAVIPATTTFRMTSLAWAVAVQGATETLEAGAADLAGSGSGPAPAALADLAGLDEPTRSAIARELTTAGITDDAGTLRPQWLRALRQSAAAPIQVSLVSRWDGFSTHCRVDLFDGRGLAVEFTRPVDTSADGRVTAVERRRRRHRHAAIGGGAVAGHGQVDAAVPRADGRGGRPDIVTGKSCPAPGRDGGKTTLSAADVPPCPEATPPASQPAWQPP